MLNQVHKSMLCYLENIEIDRYFNWKSDFNLSLFIIVSFFFFSFIVNFPIKPENWIKWKRKK